MEKLYTILYTINNFNSSNEELINTEELLDKKSKYNNNVSGMLSKISFSPRKEVVENVLNLFKTAEVY